MVAIVAVDVGSGPGAGNGETLYNAFTKINSNTAQLVIDNAAALQAAQTAAGVASLAQTDADQALLDAAAALLAAQNASGAVTSVAGKTGVVTLAKADISGLNNVENTADLAKPTSTQAAADIALGDKARLKAEIYSDFVASGLVTAVPSSTLIATMSAGVAYVNGLRVEKVASTVRTYIASRDTYVDIDSTGQLYYDEQLNLAGEPTVVAGRLRLEKVVTGATVTQVISYAKRLPKGEPFGIERINTLFTKKLMGTTVNTGKNLVNWADPDVVLGYFPNALTGLLQANATYNTTGFIPITGGLSYRLSYGNQLCWYDNEKNFVGGTMSLGSTAATVTAPARASFMRTMAQNSNYTILQVELGTTSTPFEAFKLTLENPTGVPVYTTPKVASVGIPQTTFLVPGKNKFNKTDASIIIGWYINAADGIPLSNATYNASGWMPVVAGTVYTLSYKHQIAWYNADKAFISGSSTGDTNKTQTAPAGAAYLRCTVIATQWDTFQVEVGTSQTVYETFGYVIKDTANGYPVRLESSVVVDYATYTTVPTYMYTPHGHEFIIFRENITKNYSVYKGLVEITAANAKQTHVATKLTPSTANTTVAVTSKIYDSSLAELASKVTTLRVSDAAKTTAVAVQVIGDSITHRMTFADIITASAGNTNLSFLGTRTSSAATPAVKCEGQGGNTLAGCHTVDYYGYVIPFMQPVTAGYKYYGQTSFWIDANAATPSYNAALFTGTKDLFSAATGRKLAPVLGDIMGEGGGYIHYDGAAWVTILSATFGGFAWNYAKYRATWNITAPNILFVMFGTNDMSGATEATFDAAFATWAAKMELMITSVQADTPTCKFVVVIPPTFGKQGDLGTISTEKAKLAMFLLAKGINATFGGREGSGVYVLDYHSIIDRDYGYDTAYEIPYTGYPGATGDGLYKADYVHPSLGGFKIMGRAFMGIVQYLR